MAVTYLGNTTEFEEGNIYTINLSIPDNAGQKLWINGTLCSWSDYNEACLDDYKIRPVAPGLTRYGEVEIDDQGIASFTIEFHQDEFQDPNEELNLTLRAGNAWWPAKNIGSLRFTIKDNYTITWLNRRRAWEYIISKQGEDIILPDALVDIQQPISDGVFEGRDLKSVAFNDGLKTIGARAFAGNELSSISLPSSITFIGESAFAYNNLTSVSIPRGVTSIGAYAFERNDISNVLIPEGVTTIEYGAFRNNNLTSVILPDSITSVSPSAFDAHVEVFRSDVSSLHHIDQTEGRALQKFQGKDLVIPNGVKSIGKRAFADWIELNSVVIPDSVTSIGEEAFQNNNLSSITIPDGITEIPDGAFMWNNLSSVSLPDSLIRIGRDAFSSNNLTEIDIPGSVKFIGGDAFNYNNLTEV